MVQHVMDQRVLWAIAELDSRLSGLHWAELARTVNLSPSRFAHVFSDETGLTPAQYLHALRMERARILLQRTFLTVKEVMAQVGLSDASHFSRDFRRYHGVAPTQARALVLGHQSRQGVFLERHLELVGRAREHVHVAARSANE